MSAGVGRFAGRREMVAGPLEPRGDAAGLGGVETLKKTSIWRKNDPWAPLAQGVLLCWRSLGLGIAAMTENQWIVATVSVAVVLIAVFVAWSRYDTIFPKMAEFLLTTPVALR